MDQYFTLVFDDGSLQHIKGAQIAERVSVSLDTEIGQILKQQLSNSTVEIQMLPHGFLSVTEEAYSAAQKYLQQIKNGAYH